jgi:NADH-quinone oxidoreductase subunit G
MKRAGDKFEPISWGEAIETVAKKFNEVKARGGKSGVIGSNHTTNEENFYLQKFAREGLVTANIDHHRTGDVATLLDAVSGKQNVLATVRDLYTTKAVLVVGSDLSQQHPLLAYQIRANKRHHNAHIYVVTPGPVREDKYAVAKMRAAEGAEMQAVQSLRDRLAAEGELIILFGDAVKGDAVRQLVAFGESLGIPVKYVPLVDYSNSRGASDMGVLPDLLPGYQPAPVAGLAYNEILGAPDLDVLWVVGANPLKSATLAATGAFVVVQDLFMTETAKRADIVLPAASAYEKHGTVTNVTGEQQRIKPAAKVMGAKPDLEIMGLIQKEMGLNLGIWKADKVLDEIRRTVRGYNVPLPVLTTGGAALTMPVNGRVPTASRPDLIRSSRDTLFTSGTLGRYSQTLNGVIEGPGRVYKG